jgi:hypothetical protein
VAKKKPLHPHPHPHPLPLLHLLQHLLLPMPHLLQHLHLLALLPLRLLLASDAVSSRVNRDGQ